MLDLGKFSMMEWSQALEGLLPTNTKGEHMIMWNIPISA
jgi:hypothetical protein